MRRLTIVIVIIAVFASFPIEKAKGAVYVVSAVQSVYSSPIQMKSAVVFANDMASVTPQDVVAWNKVAWCETHANWSAHGGGVFHGGLGIRPYNWVYFGGLFFAPHAYEASPKEQIFIAKKIQQGFSVPDQNGQCRGW
jgi:hypothetical protein